MLYPLIPGQEKIACSKVPNFHVIGSNRNILKVGYFICFDQILFTESKSTKRAQSLYGRCITLQKAYLRIVNLTSFEGESNFFI